MPATTGPDPATATYGIRPPGPARAIVALMLREVAQSGGRLAGGHLWSVVAPVAVVGLLAAAFALVLRSPPIGTSFLVFYASGYLPFRLYAEVQGAASSAPRLARGLLAYPAITPLDTILARGLLAILTHLIAGLIALGMILGWTGAGQVAHPGGIVAAAALAIMLGLGAGTLNAVLFDRFPLWQTVFAVLSRPLILVSAVVWLPQDLPPAARDMILWNPLVHIVGLARSGLYPTYRADYANPVFVASVALGLMVIGLLLLRLHGRRFTEG
jgi:capsular polysaccharide transport system permease protein